jgi:hypothetical protein
MRLDNILLNLCRVIARPMLAAFLLLVSISSLGAEELNQLSSSGVSTDQKVRIPQSDAVSSSEQKTTDTAAGHVHSPIVVRSRPVIERLPLSVIDPVDIRISRDGTRWIADRGANAVFQVLQNGTTGLAATEISGIRRIVVTSDNNLFLLTGTQGSGRVWQVLADGPPVEVAHLNFPPAGMVVDSVGNIFVSSAQSSVLQVIGADGTQRSPVALPDKSVDLTMNSSEQVFALLSSGNVVRVGLDGGIDRVGFGTHTSIRLFPFSDGKLTVLDAAPGERPVIRQLSTTEGTSGTVLAGVPRGTVAAGFDSLGNVTLLNPELRAVTRVTSRMMIPCPHCGMSVPLIFSTADPAVSDDQGRGF